MVGHRIAYGLWLLGWLLVWALSKSAMPGCILAGSLGAAALEIALTALADRYLRVSLCAQLSAQKGETVEALLTVENGSVLTCAAVCLRVGCRNLLTGEQGERRLRFSVAGKQKRSAAAAFSVQRCGKLEFSLRDLRVYDLFGLYGRKISCDARAYSLVLPELYPVQLSFSDRSSVELDSDEYSMHHPGDDPSETFALREYVPGDRVRSIHWKLTEKTGEVIVRQLGLPVNHSILLLMDNSVSAPCAPEDCEALGELTASVSAALCSAGFAHQIAWFDREEDCIATAQAESDDTLTQALAELLAAQIVPDETTTVQRWLTTRGPLNYAHVVLLTLRQEQQDVQAADGGAVTVLRAGRLDGDARTDLFENRSGARPAPKRCRRCVTGLSNGCPMPAGSCWA